MTRVQISRSRSGRLYHFHGHVARGVESSVLPRACGVDLNQIVMRR